MQKKPAEPVKSSPVTPQIELDPTEIPFREFRDNELSIEYWGMNAATFRTILATKTVIKQSLDYVWVDEQTQPLPRSVRQYLHGWVRADELALSRWQEAETVVFEEAHQSSSPQKRISPTSPTTESGADKMAIIDMQLSHTQVLQRSSFCRRVLSVCFMLENLESLIVEHQWENFSCSLPDGWRPRFHIYSPGTKPGGGLQHRPGLSKNGCYLVRLYYLGAWRCVWVSDQVPVDATGAPLLPFSPLLSPAPTKQAIGRQQGQQASVAAATAPVVHLWPLLICKALLKLAAPDMNSDEESTSIEDEVMPEFKILHALTGAMEMDVNTTGSEDLWEKILAVTAIFSWESEEDDVITKSKVVKKEKNAKDTTIRPSLAVVTIEDTQDLPPYTLPGISPGHEMGLYVSMVRDLPLKKPLSEPDVALWKYFRWVDWARSHGLYEAYDCPRTRFLKLTGFLKLSYAPHLLDVQSTETITMEFRKAHDHSGTDRKEKVKDISKDSAAAKEESRDWVLYENISELVKQLTIIYFPSMYNFTSAGSAPSVKITKVPMNRALDILAPKSSPMYLQIDSPNSNHLKISLSVLHPRVIMNSGVPVLDDVEPAYLILECFDWFVHTELQRAKAYVSTRGYGTVKVNFLPGRHYCRIWVHSPTNWHMALLSESTLLLGRQDLIQGASVRECPWAVQFLSNLGNALINLLRSPKSLTNLMTDCDFYKSYQPDLTWDDEVVGYKKHLLHWMFRRALQSLLVKRLTPAEFHDACIVLRRYLLAPEFGLPEKQPDLRNYRDLIRLDPCDCTIPEPEVPEESAISEEIQLGEETRNEISPSVLRRLLSPPTLPNVSTICELATAEHLCGELKEEREKLIRMHEAATLLQAHWRGTRARKCLKEKVVVTPEVMKVLMESTLGSPDALSALMNEFFSMYPGAKHAYSVASALSGTTGLQSYAGVALVTRICKWIPYFQGTFHCHDYVKVHFALHGTLQFNTMAVYDNDTGLQLPQVFRTATVFDIKPNTYGYMVMGHGTLTKPLGVNSEAHWQLTVLSSIRDTFHVCDNNIGEYCHELSLPLACKLHIDSLFVPNRRNILGGIKFTVMQSGAVRFRAAASSPELDMVAILRTTTDFGDMEVVGTCAGKGEIFWPYIKMEAAAPELLKTKSLHRSRLNFSRSQLAKKLRAVSAAGSKKGGFGVGSTVKVKDAKGVPSQQSKLYTIELICPDGWPLSLDQWRRVEEVRNNLEPLKAEPAAKKPPSPSKTSSARGEKQAPPPPSRMQPQPGDAYAELECSVALGSEIMAVRDDDRELEFEAARRLWDSKEPGRNQRGAQIRKDFRDEFLEVPVPVAEMLKSIEGEVTFGEYLGEEIIETKKEEDARPSPVTESALIEMSIESEEEALFLHLPEQLKDKFVTLPFIPLCMKESVEEERVLITPEIFEAGISERHLKFEGALNRMRELQEHNKMYVLGQHRERCMLLNKLYVDGNWTPGLQQVLDERNDAITKEALALTLDANKKKQEQKKK